MPNPHDTVNRILEQLQTQRTRAAREPVGLGMLRNAAEAASPTAGARISIKLYAGASQATYFQVSKTTLSKIVDILEESAIENVKENKRELAAIVETLQAELDVSEEGE